MGIQEFNGHFVFYFLYMFYKECDFFSFFRKPNLRGILRVKLYDTFSTFSSCFLGFVNKDKILIQLNKVNLSLRP